MNDERVVLLVEFTSGEVVAVPFTSRDAADRWEQSHDYEVIGRPRIATARSLSVGARKAREVMTADEPLFELADVGLELVPTEAMRRGEQFVHQCAWCGAVVVWHRRKTTDSLGLCPNCGSDAGGNPAESSTWWRQRLPLAGIAPLGLAAWNRLVDDLIAQLHTSEITEWDEARVAAWLRACAAAPHASVPGDGGDR